MKRYPGLTLRVLAEGEPAIGPGKAELMRLIENTGSISAAAREMKMSYRRAWQLVEALNSSFTQPVIVTSIGGKAGGGAELTDMGREIVRIYTQMENDASAAIASDLRRLRRFLRAAR
jgi:molybdate transport system regulatory protein